MPSKGIRPNQSCILHPGPSGTSPASTMHTPTLLLEQSHTIGPQVQSQETCEFTCSPRAFPNRSPAWPGLVTGPPLDNNWIRAELHSASLCLHTALSRPAALCMCILVLHPQGYAEANTLLSIGPGERRKVNTFCVDQLRGQH